MVNFLIEAAHTGKVQRLAIVDDAYDPPRPAEISENAFNQFVQAFEDVPAVRNDLNAVVSDDTLDDYERFTTDVMRVRRLWDLHLGIVEGVAVAAETRDALQRLFDDVSLDRQSKLAQLRPLEELLEAVAPPVLRFASDTPAERVASADVVFLDLYLSDAVPFAASGATPVGVYDAARERAIDYLRQVREVANADPTHTAPAFVLISSQGSQAVAEDFRDSAKQLAVRFRFISKQALATNEPHELLAIGDIFRTCAASAFLEPIQQSWPTVLKEASAWVEERLRNLTIADFGRLYHLSLQNEGQALDDYVKELSAAALAERVAHAYGAPSAGGGEKPFAGLAAYFEPPSNAFAELYAAGRISTAPRSENPLPQHGDVYLVGRRLKSRPLVGRELIAVMSGACDLIDRDGTGPKAEAAMLLHGTVRPPMFPNDAPQILAMDGRYYEIEWRFTRPDGMPPRTIQRRERQKRLTWIGRLKGEHFLALQETYFGTVGRIGLLKSPRVVEPLAGEISALAGTARAVLASFGADRSYAYLVEPKTSFEKQHIVFTGPFVQYFWQQLATAAESTAVAEIVRTKAKGIMERRDRVLRLIEAQNAKSHSIQNYLTVELHETNDQPVKETVAGVVVVRLWSE
ncbi:MAG TPA: hypothetical protein VFN10_19410 [Thermoanaerobaculia bacterium]|nr:hypothetical protein [Thermoanaerobaculia bacterium]